MKAIYFVDPMEEDLGMQLRELQRDLISRDIDENFLSKITITNLTKDLYGGWEKGKSKKQIVKIVQIL